MANAPSGDKALLPLGARTLADSRIASPVPTAVGMFSSQLVVKVTDTVSASLT